MTVPGIFHFFGSIEKNWYRKKSRNQYRKKSPGTSNSKDIVNSTIKTIEPTVKSKFCTDEGYLKMDIINLPGSSIIPGRGMIFQNFCTGVEKLKF